jgi:hypothetical protein
VNANVYPFDPAVVPVTVPRTDVADGRDNGVNNTWVVCTMLFPGSDTVIVPENALKIKNRVKLTDTVPAPWVPANPKFEPVIDDTPKLSFVIRMLPEVIGPSNTSARAPVNWIRIRSVTGTGGSAVTLSVVDAVAPLLSVTVSVIVNVPAVA